MTSNTVSGETESKLLWLVCHTCVNDLLKHKRSLRTASPEWDIKVVPEDRYHGINLRRCQLLMKYRNAFRVIITLYGSTGSCGFVIESDIARCSQKYVFFARNKFYLEIRDCTKDAPK